MDDESDLIPPAPMRLRYRVTTWANARAAAAVMRCYPLVRKLRKVGLAGLGVGLAALVAGQGIGLYLFGVGVGVVAILWAVGYTQGLTNWWGNRLHRRDQVLTLSAEGLLMEGAPASSAIGWEAITAVIPTRHFIVLLMGPWAGVAIPRKRLDDIPDEALLQRLRSWEGWPALSDQAPGARPFDERDGEVLVRFEATRDVIAGALRDITWRSWVGPVNVVALGGIWGFVGLRPWLRALRDPAVPALALGMLTILLGGVFVWAVVGAPKLQAKRAAESPLIRGKVQEVGASALGLRTRGPLSQLELDWDAVRKVRETNRFFLAFVSQAVAVYVPKAAMEPEAVEALRALFTAHGELRASGRVDRRLSPPGREHERPSDLS